VRRPMRCGLGQLRRFACRTAEHVASVSAEPDRAGQSGIEWTEMPRRSRSGTGLWNADHATQGRDNCAQQSSASAEPGWARLSETELTR
jgi:hypothetical protein